MANGNESKPIRLVGRGKQLALLKECRDKLRDKKAGSMITISAESGYGVSSFLRFFEQENASAISSPVIAYAECQAPVGGFHIGSLQSLYPFLRVAETLADREKKSAEKRLVLNIGVSLLSAMPWVGDVFFAAKEIARDVRDYKREKKDADQMAGPQGGVISEMFDFIIQYAQNRPLVLLLDSTHFADAQSVELLSKLYDAVQTLPLMVVVGYSPTGVETAVSPLLQILKRFKADDKRYFHTELTVFSPAELGDCCAMYLPDYGRNPQFERWLAERTSGIPSLVVEYLRYFQQYPPFAGDGSMREDAAASDILPPSIHAAFSKLVEKLSDDDRTILALCSVEGMEPTVNIMSALMNVDALTTVRKLRSLQRRTGIIRSLGSKRRYGVKTTVYEFTQEFYYQFFRNSLEYEESVALHRQVASLLDKTLQDIENPAERLNIMPYLVAHNSEADDASATKEILIEAAKSAEAAGDDALAQEVFARYATIFGESAIAKIKSEETEKGDSEIATERILDNSSNAPDDAITGDDIPMDFPAIQREIIGYITSGTYSEAADKSRHYADIYKQRLLSEERAVLFVLGTRAHTELGENDEAEKLCRKALDILRSFPDAPAECLAYNALALIRLQRNETDAAWNELRRAAKIASSIGQEYQLLTVSNIGNLLRKLNPKKSIPYLALAKRMCRSLNFRVFMEEYLL
ncbi:hypothetical protein MASR2M18_00850 [Ignavibacteria bacterium]